MERLKWNYAIVILFWKSSLILGLGQLSNESNFSFFTYTSSNLYDDKKPNAEPKREIDIICIKNGKFIIGEVKKPGSSFTDSNFRNMAEVAERIRPDKIIFSSQNKRPNKNVRENIKNLRKKMKNIDIEVEWYNLHRFIFEPSLP